jgi:hypothetical protein
MQLAAQVAKKIDEWMPDAVFVDAGNGSGVIDRLRQLGYDVIEVHFGGKPAEAQYQNKRTEMWFNTREWLNASGALPDLPQLKQDLGAPIYWYDPSGRICLEPKDEIKKRGLPSPDFGDALALTFAHPVARRSAFETTGRSMQNAAFEVYDPYGNI